MKEKFYTPAPGTKLPTATCQQEFHPPRPQRLPANQGVELASASNGSQKGGIFFSGNGEKVEKDED